MRVVIAGGTGFLGQALTRQLERDRHSVVLLSRQADNKETARQVVCWNPDGTAGAWAETIDGADAVVNLAGTSIAGRRWTDAHKRDVLDSRVNATRSLVGAIARAARPPQAFISGSAVGYYGPHGDEVITESAPAGSDFLAGVCVAWEQEAMTAAAHTRVVPVRTGLVLARQGGALPEMLTPFRFGVGGPIGSGRQYWPWVHVDDWVAMVVFALTNDRVAGPINVTGPAPVPNRVFAQALGRAMHRPSFMPTPAFALRMLLGEMAEGLLLSGQRAIPRRSTDEGFVFRYPELSRALASLFK